MYGKCIGRLLLNLGLTTLLCAGCVPSHSHSRRTDITDDVPRIARPRTVPEKEPTIHQPANLEHLIQLATQYHPDLHAAQARIEAARGRMIQAGLYPNPLVGPRGTELLEHGNPWGQSGAIIMQQFVTANKLGLARAAGAAGVEAADWQALTKWYEVVTRVRLSYFELLTALRERQTIQDIVRVSTDAYKAAENERKLGTGTRPDVLRSKVQLEQNQLQLEVSQRRVEAARQNLITALGRPAVMLERL